MKCLLKCLLKYLRLSLITTMIHSSFDASYHYLSGISIKPSRLLSAALLPFALAGCTLSEVSSEISTETVSQPAISVRLPSIRLANRSTVSIDSLTAEQTDKTVAIAGTVDQRAAVLEGWLYKVSDDSGSLWVLSDESTPEVGEAVTIEGVVRYEEIVVGEIDAGDVYLQEQSYEPSGE